MHFIYNNIAVLVTAAIVSTIGWLYGGTRASALVPVVPWLILFALEALYFFPQKGSGESTYDARERVWRALKKDPLVWTSLGLLALLAIPFANNGLCVSCDRALIAQGLSPDPAVPFLPYCVNRLQHLNVFLWFAMAFTTMITAKHALSNHGKRLAADLIVWNGFLMALLGFIEIAAGAEGPFWQPMTNVKDAGNFFSTFGYPNMAGDYFVVLFGLGVACWRAHYEAVRAEFAEHPNNAAKNSYRNVWRKHLYLIPTATFFFAAVNTLSRAAIMLVCSLAAIAFIHTFIVFTRRYKKAERVKRGTLALAIVGLTAFFAITSMPEDLQKEVDTIDADAVLTRVSGRGQYHTRIATDIWMDNFLFGCGGWGYKHFCIPKMKPEEYKELQTVGGINVHNDYLQFLAEHGLVGFLGLVAIVTLLVAPVGRQWRKLVKAAHFAQGHDKPPKPVHIFALPAPTFFILLSALATLVHSFGDCPLRSAAVSTLFFAILALAPGYLKHEEDMEQEPEHHHHHHHHG